MSLSSRPTQRTLDCQFPCLMHPHAQCASNVLCPPPSWWASTPPSRNHALRDCFVLKNYCDAWHDQSTQFSRSWGCPLASFLQCSRCILQFFTFKVHWPEFLEPFYSIWVQKQRLSSYISNVHFLWFSDKISVHKELILLYVFVVYLESLIPPSVVSHRTLDHFLGVSVSFQRHLCLCHFSSKSGSLVIDQTVGYFYLRMPHFQPWHPLYDSTGYVDIDQYAFSLYLQ